ncbi:MAG: hypothetical protein D6762_01940 [Candidatus Neomarinimicrobiota bacterium]|nr:MAG: hypothetical protein D6762_01940 [Candidatus Neomarinimicrobiota bacterium]
MGKFVNSNQPLGAEMSHNRFRQGGIALAALFLIWSTGCQDQPTDNTVILENNESVLLERIDYKHEVIPLDTVFTGASRGQAAVIDTIILTLVAEVQPPIYNGDTLQATDVKLKGKHAYVSYNYQGEVFLGGVDVFDIRTPDQPRLTSSVLFTDTDVNGVTRKGNDLYLASATENPDYSSPAILQKIQLQNDQLTDNITTLDIGSFAATDVDLAGNYIYVTSGADGGMISIVDKSTFTVFDTYPVEDARGVDADGGDVGVVAGTPARLVVLDGNLGSVIGDYTLTGATIPFSKSTIKIRKKKALLGVGDGGMQAICIQDGSLIAQIDQPLLSDLPPEKTVTNSVSADKRLLFMADGEAGVYVAATNSNLNSNNCSFDNLHMVGKFRFGTGQSANHVEFNNNVLFVASGLGGLKILTVEFNNDHPDHDDEDDSDH